MTRPCGALSLSLILFSFVSCLSATHPRATRPVALPDTFQRPLSSTLYWTLPACRSTADCATAYPDHQPSACMRGSCVLTPRQAGPQTVAACHTGTDCLATVHD